MTHRILFLSLLAFLCTSIFSAPPDPLNKEIEDGFLYRKLDGKIEGNVDGVYAKDITYGEESLFADSHSIKEYIFSKEEEDGNNWLGAVFFGVWSYGENNATKKLVSVPVRLTSQEKTEMFSEEPEEDGCKILIWATNKKQGNDGEYHVYSPKKVHTESKFTEYTQADHPQKALWHYFLYQTSKTADIKDIPAENRRLDLIGFTLYSTNDACDSCLDQLLQFKKNFLHRLVENTFIKEGKNFISESLPFVITYQSTRPYGLASCFGDFKVNLKSKYAETRASMVFTLPRQLYRLTATNVKDGDWRAESEKESNTIKHQENMELQSKKNPTFIIFKINEGKYISLGNRFSSDVVNFWKNAFL